MQSKGEIVKTQHIAIKRMMTKREETVFKQIWNHAFSYTLTVTLQSRESSGRLRKATIQVNCDSAALRLTNT